MAQKPKPEQTEIPGTESPDRIPELHALWLDICAAEEESREARGREKELRANAAQALKERGLKEYFVDGAELWIEPQEKVKAHKRGKRPKGKVTKVVTAEKERA